MYGGIEPSKSASTVFIYSDPRAGAAYGYDYDGWSSDGSVFLYTGEGRRGHQRMRGRNAAILNHDADGRKLRLFVADGTEPGTDTRIQRYLGEFQVSPDEPFVTAEAPDVDGNQRTVIVFRLTPKGDFLQRDEDASPSGDVSPTPSAEAVSVEAAETPAGSADPVPVEALGSATYPLAGSTATVAVTWEAELVARYQVYLEGQGSVCVRYKLRPPGELSPAYSGLCRG